MAEQWIDAATALDLVAAVSGQSGAPRIICTRAHGGILSAKAKLLTYGEQSATDAVIPATFWWAEGEAALDQTWAPGDFSTLIEGKTVCRAFGVTFPLSGILELLPTDRRADVTRRLSVAGQPEWSPVAEASLLACRLPGVRDGRAHVIEQARLGLLQGQAVLAERFASRHHKDCIWGEREWPISTHFWEGVARATDVYQECDLGRLSAGVTVDGKPSWLRLSGVHILAKPLRDALSGSAPPAPDPVPKQKAGGRPAQPWWDDLWSDICVQIFEGKLITERLSDVEKAMHTWVQDHDYTAADSTIRLKAQKLFNAMKEAENSPAR